MMTQTTHHREYMRVTFEFGIAFTGVAILLAAFVAVLAYLSVGTGTAAAFVFFSILAAASIVLALALVFSTRRAHGLIVEGFQILFDTWERGETAKADALTGASVVQNITSTGDNARIKAPVTAPRLTVMGKEIAWGDINKVEAHQTINTVQEVKLPRQDTLWILQQFATAGLARRLYEKEKLPYSGLRVYPNAYNAAIAALVESGKLIGRAEGTSGQLVTGEIGELVKAVDTVRPRGMTIELPATTALPDAGK